MYLYSGDFILALTQNATHKLWRWHCDDQHSSSKVLPCYVMSLYFHYLWPIYMCLSPLIFFLQASANVQPQLYQPSSGLIMTNEIGRQPENAISCFSLNDSHLYSASGGKIYIFSLETFEVNEKIYAIYVPMCLHFLMASIQFSFAFLLIAEIVDIWNPTSCSYIFYFPSAEYLRHWLRWLHNLNLLHAHQKGYYFPDISSP